MMPQSQPPISQQTSAPPPSTQNIGAPNYSAHSFATSGPSLQSTAPAPSIPQQSKPAPPPQQPIADPFAALTSPSFRQASPFQQQHRTSPPSSLFDLSAPASVQHT